MGGACAWRRWCSLVADLRLDPGQRGESLGQVGGRALQLRQQCIERRILLRQAGSEGSHLSVEVVALLGESVFLRGERLPRAGDRATGAERVRNLRIEGGGDATGCREQLADGAEVCAERSVETRGVDTQRPVALSGDADARERIVGAGAGV